MLLAAHAQRSLRNPDRVADLRDVERVLRLLLHRIVEAAHDNRVLTSRRAVLALLLIAEAADRGFDQSLLETSCGVRISDYFPACFSPSAPLLRVIAGASSSQIAEGCGSADFSAVSGQLRRSPPRRR